jgi:hypothetical protein
MGRRKEEPRNYGKCNNPKHFNAKPELAAAYWELYQQGFSPTAIGKFYGVTRGAVYTLLVSHGYEIRSKKQLPFIAFNGGKYTLKPTGYYARTDKERSLLHRDIWEYHNGKIPDGWDVHHINSNKQDNRIKNLECMPSSEHTKLHGKNRDFSTRRLPSNTRSVKRLDTGKIYPSIREASRDIDRDPSCIQLALRKKTKAAGIYWEYS